MLKHWMAMALVLLVMPITLLSCGSFSPPESCEGITTGVADEELFNQIFHAMELVRATTGEPGKIGSEGEVQFDSGEALKIDFESTVDGSFRACVMERKGGGEVVLDDEMAFTAGVGAFNIDAFSRGSYVIRVAVDDILVKNLPFIVE
jgi:hypothetical protein